MYTSEHERETRFEKSESARLEGLYRKATDPVLRTHLLMVWRMSLGDSIREVAGMVGYSQKWTREIARRYEEQGVEGLGDGKVEIPEGIYTLSSCPPAHPSYSQWRGCGR